MSHVAHTNESLCFGVRFETVTANTTCDLQTCVCFNCVYAFRNFAVRASPKSGMKGEDSGLSVVVVFTPEKKFGVRLRTSVPTNHFKGYKRTTVTVKKLLKVFFTISRVIEVRNRGPLM